MKKSTFNYRKFVKDLVDARFDLEHKTKKRHGLREMAKVTDISVSTLSRVLSGKNMDIDTLITLCAWMGKKVDVYIN